MKNTSHTPAPAARSHPIGLDVLNVAQGQIGFGPLLEPAALGTDCPRDPDAEVAIFAAWGADLVISLLSPDAGIRQNRDLAANIQAAGIGWLTLRIPDTTALDASWWQYWQKLSPGLHARLERGARIALHGPDGPAPAAFVAALLLMERGMALAAALERIEAACPDARPLPAHVTALTNALPPLTDAAARNRACLMGGAIGDAMGAEIEFWSLARIRTHFPDGSVHLIAHQGQMGAITDDTQMTLFTAEGILRAMVRAETRGICHAPGVVHHALLRWLQTQGEVPQVAVDTQGLVTDARLHHRRAPGLTCLGALRGAKGFGNVATNSSKGCGTIMRVAPVALCSATSPQQLALETSALTHGHPTGQEAAAAFVAILLAVMRGVAIERAATDALAQTTGETALALARALSAPRDGRAETVESLGGGWIAEEALAIAVYAALASDSFADGLQIALCHSGDSDSTAAVAGNLLGLLYPAQVARHPAHDQIECADLIERIARDLALAEDPGTEGSDTFHLRYPGW